MLAATDSPLDATAPSAARYVTPLGDRRERPVPCWWCRQPTFALDATCDDCHDVPGAVAPTRAARAAAARRAQMAASAAGATPGDGSTRAA